MVKNFNSKTKFATTQRKAKVAKELDVHLLPELIRKNANENESAPPIFVVTAKFPPRLNIKFYEKYKKSKKNQKKSKNWGLGGPKIEKNRVFRGMYGIPSGSRGVRRGTFRGFGGSGRAVLGV